MEQKLDINPIPYLTWTWLKINKDSIEVPVFAGENTGCEVQIPDGVTISSGKSIKTELPEPENAIGSQAADLITQSAAEGKIYTFERGKAGDDTKPLIIRISADQNNATHQIIHAKTGVTAKVIIVYDGGTDKSSLSGIITKVYAEDDSNIYITKVQLCGKNVNQIDNTSVVCGERAKVSLTQIELGGSHIDASFHTTLAGYQSQFTSDTAYICRGTQYLDMNQVVVHKGKKTVCNMKTDGTVKDETTKTYRGTIDLVKGCTGSKGNEIETTLLLSPKAVVKAAPIILCGEEDISAEHGSTIGKLSNEMLFYMNSRGIDQKTAEDLLTRAKITAAAANIPDEGVHEEIENWLEK
ncbi:MAG: SufD family Fe-S cluster assembly protein [Treponema sp.]|nr:SufD family Fe-S cluster assembly protein [Treponema sp.]